MIAHTVNVLEIQKPSGNKLRIYQNKMFTVEAFVTASVMLLAQAPFFSISLGNVQFMSRTGTSLSN